jgi:hypothetical protein
MRRPGSKTLALVTAALLAGAAPAAWFEVAPDGVSTAERFELDPRVAARLAATEPEDTVRLADWPVAPGVRTAVRLTRHDVYASGAPVLVVTAEGAVEARRSRLAFFWGEADDPASSRVLAIADPDTATLVAFSEAEDGWNEVRPDPEVHGEYLIAPSRSLLGEAADRLTRDCAQAPLPAPPEPAVARSGAAFTGGLRQAVLAIDTDNELLVQKFGNNTTAATDYVATLVALVSTVYERDLGLRVLQGTTFLRPSTAADPWAQSGTGNADSAKVNELRAYWSANHAAVPRAATVLLSGKQANAYASSGIAYVDALCSSAYGYGFVQVFKFAGSTASSDLMVTAHELGHVIGSRHTHCYLTPTPIDTCYAGEAGCHAGATACPTPQTINGVTNVRGTLMSYCHLLSGCASATVLHPRTASLLGPIVDAKTGVCVTGAGTPKEASPSGNLVASRSAQGGVTVTFAPACGATDHTGYTGDLAALAASGPAWTGRHCGLGASGTATFQPPGSAVYFVVVANNGAVEGSYGRTSSGTERSAAGPGGACAYTQQLSGSCP